MRVFFNWITSLYKQGKFLRKSQTTWKNVIYKYFDLDYFPKGL